MSVAVLYADCPTFYVSPSATGFSDDSKNFCNALKNQFREICKPFSIGSSLEETVQSIYQIYKECSVDNWDASGANPISKDSALEAIRFISLLPSSFPMPHVIAEPSGEIGLEWYRNSQLIFALSFDGKSMISFAGIFGFNKLHGCEYFGDTIPSIIVESLKRLYL